MFYQTTLILVAFLEYATLNEYSVVLLFLVFSDHEFYSSFRTLVVRLFASIHVVSMSRYYIGGSNRSDDRTYFQLRLVSVASL